MSKLKLTIAYDGRSFSGWQSQPNKNTVQDVLCAALAEIAKKPIQIHGSGRTDAGVHADGQVAHFEPPAEIDMNPYNWVPALNTKLPPSIRILDCIEIPDDFHARFSAKEKTYLYDLCLAPVLHPHMYGRAWHLPRQLDPISLGQALEHYLGEHCFRAFAANRGNETEETEYTRMITRSDFHTLRDGYRLTFTGNGFMYKMVRLLTGAAVQVAQGRLRLDDHLSLLDQPDGLPFGKSPYCAPADGLTLLEVKY
jgi:tRNA pseudouridine38-40 synthase